MVIYDSTKKQKVEFEPLVPSLARIYVCGPTVYDNAHLGHARSAITFDLLRRILMLNGYRVIFVKNFTDIDDKIIKKSKETGESIAALTQKYTQSYLEDMDALGVLRADIEPKATQNLEAMWAMIQALLDKKSAYRAPNGDIYMRVESDKKYGSLSNRANLESQISRIGENDAKEDSRDFALWKIFENPSDFAYDSPFGRGRPGWHIECSAMIEAHLAGNIHAEKSSQTAAHAAPNAAQNAAKNEAAKAALADNAAYSIDIHAGGADLLFPHHENEASQSRCANGRELAKYWMHNGFVTVNGEKMSKSLGNGFFVKDALMRVDGEVLRYYLLSMHYRAGLNFSLEDVFSAKKRLNRIYRLKKRVGGEFAGQSEKGAGLNPAAQNAADPAFRAAFLEALNDDLNISIALSEVDSMISHCNALLDAEPKNHAHRALAAANLALIDAALGIGGMDAARYFQLGVSEEKRAEIEAKIAERQAAKAAKNYALADEIRWALKAQNIALLDTKEGVAWEVEEDF